MNRFLLNLGALALGVALGMGLAWYVFPVRYVDTEPGTLRPQDRAQALGLIAEAYLSEQDAARARERTLALGEADPAQTFTALAQQASAAGDSPERVRALSALARALGTAPGVAVAPPTVTAPPPPTPTNLPPTATVPPSPPTNPPPTPVVTFALAEIQPVCDPAQAGQLQVVTQDRVGNPVSAVEIQVTWDNGQQSDRFFTGLKPELGLGYGDFSASDGLTYTVKLVLAQPVTLAEVSLPACSGPFTGAVRVVARQP